MIAAVLILAVLFLFLRDWRSALITFLAIPLSLLAAVAVLDRMGQTLNTMTLGGFAVALGVLVDDAIIGIENILRRLGENAKLPEPRPRLAVIRDATLEVRGPVVYATLVVIAVFLPELFSTSVQGHFVGAAGAGLHPGGAGLAGRGADRDAGAVRADAQGARRPCRFRLDPRAEGTGRTGRSSAVSIAISASSWRCWRC